jgi:hypothetical protein
MGLCGMWFSGILSLVAAVKNDDWRAVYKSGMDECKTYIQDFI